MSEGPQQQAMPAVEPHRPAPADYAPDRPPARGMVWIPGGDFLMGSDDFYPEERPVHRVAVDGFW
ncbi:MAG: SUMF1/EgtB/PvdO family nonheme iron enzyme, partial [Nocardioidaceae bacterium]